MSCLLSWLVENMLYTTPVLYSSLWSTVQSYSTARNSSSLRAVPYWY